MSFLKIHFILYFERMNVYTVNFESRFLCIIKVRFKICEHNDLITLYFIVDSFTYEMFMNEHCI